MVLIRLLIKCIGTLAFMALLALPARADMSAFHEGPLIKPYGRIANIDTDGTLNPDTKLKVVFDLSDAAKPGTVNRGLDTVARFLNMHVEAGLAPENIEVAVVVHGEATLDMAKAEVYQARKDEENANAALIHLLAEHGVAFYQCGQSAAYHDITKDDLLPEVTMTLSAMTAFALLQQDGYTLNPF